MMATILFLYGFYLDAYMFAGHPGGPIGGKEMKF